MEPGPWISSIRTSKGIRIRIPPEVKCSGAPRRETPPEILQISTAEIS
jgi:hypothetical protein